MENDARREDTDTRKFVLRDMRRPLKPHVRRRPFVMTAASDHSWINCQSALTAVQTSDGVCVRAHVLAVKTDKGSQSPSVAEQQQPVNWLSANMEEKHCSQVEEWPRNRLLWDPECFNGSSINAKSVVSSQSSLQLSFMHIDKCGA